MARPNFAINSSRFSALTAGLSYEEKGVLLTLMTFYWNKQGALSDRDNRLAKMLNLSPKKWEKLRPAIEKFFVVVGDTWLHTGLEEQIRCATKNRSRNPEKTVDDGKRPPIAEWREIRERIFARDNYTCSYCGVRGTKLECDHIYPVARGGTHEDSNLTTACLKCNRSKRSKTLAEWIR